MKRTYRQLADSVIGGGWQHESSDGRSATDEQLQTACLIDIAQSLRAIRVILACPNTQKIPRHLQAIESLAREFWVKPRRRRKKAARSRVK